MENENICTEIWIKKVKGVLTVARFLYKLN